MKYTNSSDFKFLISFKRISKNLKAIAKDVLACIGLLVTLEEFVSSVFGYNYLSDIYSSWCWWILGALVFLCVIKNWDHLNLTVKISGSPDVTITLSVCDAIRTKNAIIIPTNTTFDTKMDDEFISEKSIQGQYQIKYFKGRLDELDEKIEKGLKEKKYKLLNDGRSTNAKRYPVGTVCRITEQGRRAYFLADADVNKRGIAIDVDANNISQALISLWETIAVEGNQESYSIPLIGTGKAKIKNASRNEVVREIILTFIAATKEHKITENLTICIHPRDFEKIDWSGLSEFLKYECQYTDINTHNTKPVGYMESNPAIIKFREDDFENKDKAILNSSSLSEPLNLSQLSAKEEKIISLLTQKEMRSMEISSSLGLSLRNTKIILNKLIKRGIVYSKFLGRNRLFYIQQRKK